MRVALLVFLACSGDVQNPMDGSVADVVVTDADASGPAKCGLPLPSGTCTKEGVMCFQEGACGNSACACTSGSWQCTNPKCDAGTLDTGTDN